MGFPCVFIAILCKSLYLCVNRYKFYQLHDHVVSYFLLYIIVYINTTWNKFSDKILTAGVCNKPTTAQIVWFVKFYGTWSFIIMVTAVHHWSIFSIRIIHHVPPLFLYNPYYLYLRLEMVSKVYILYSVQILGTEWNGTSLHLLKDNTKFYWNKYGGFKYEMWTDGYDLLSICSLYARWQRTQNIDQCHK